MTAEADTAIRAWLALIEETDPAIIDDVLSRCRENAEARAYFVGRAAAGPSRPPIRAARNDAELP